MAWVRIHDGALSHPKLVGLIDWKNPFCVWVWGLSYVQMHLTDGVIVKAALPNAAAARTASRLVDAGLWHDDGATFRIHDYFDWNDAKQKILDEREKTRKRIAAWRAKQESSNASGNASGNGVTERVTNGAHATPRHEGRS